MPRLPLDYQDSELHAIAETFNAFLSELENFFKREHSLMNLASHELRTPIAVVSGALDILEQRDQLQPKDRVTITRIRQATSEMESNVNVLLKLARREELAPLQNKIALNVLVHEVLNDLLAQHEVNQRVKFVDSGDVMVFADVVLAKMLLRNLIQNALQHTLREVRVRLEPNLIEIADDGAGLKQAQLARIEPATNAMQASLSLGGLGLYIATMMCERLHWRLDVNQSSPKGTVIHITFNHHGPANTPAMRHESTRAPVFEASDQGLQG